MIEVGIGGWADALVVVFGRRRGGTGGSGTLPESVVAAGPSFRTAGSTRHHPLPTSDDRISKDLSAQLSAVYLVET